MAVRKTETGFACLVCHQPVELTEPIDLRQLTVSFIDRADKPPIRVLRLGDAEVHRCDMPNDAQRRYGTVT